jgi:hypothetical protein
MIPDDDLEGLIDTTFTMTVAELKEHLKSYGLPVSGKREDLCARLAFQWSYIGDRWAKQNKPVGMSEYEFYMSFVTGHPQAINYWTLKILKI